MTTVDVSTLSKQNLWLDSSGDLVVRDGFSEEVTSTSLAGANYKFVDGFSLKSPNTGETFHYLFLRNTSDGTGKVYVCDEELQELWSGDLGQLPTETVVTHAFIASPSTASQELLINSPDFDPLYGTPGSGLLSADKVEDSDPNTTAIDIPRGICTAFAGRVVIASGPNIFFSNGQTLRTFVGINAGSLFSAIYSLNVSESGNLLIGADNGVWALPPDAVARGLAVRDLFIKVSDHQSTGFKKSALDVNVLFALSQNGLVQATNPSLPELNLDEDDQPRSISSPVHVTDYRRLTVHAWEAGVVVSDSDRWAVFDNRRQFASWWIAPDGYDLEVVGVLREGDGASLFVTPDRVVSVGAELDIDGADVVGVAAGSLNVAPASSTLIRSVTVASDSHGNQKASVCGDTATSKTGVQYGTVIGTDSWSASTAYDSKRIRSTRHKHYVRTDEVSYEVAAEKSGSRLRLIEVEFGKQVGRRRP